MLSLLWVGLVVVGAALTVGAFFLDNELLARIGVYRVHLLQLRHLRHLLLLELLELLCLLLLVLFKAFFALVTGQLTVGCPFGHVLGLRRRALRADRAPFHDTERLNNCVGRAAHVARFVLQVDRIFILAACVRPIANLAPVVLVVNAELRRLAVGNHVHVRSTVRVVLLAVIRRKLVLVLEEGVLGTLGTARAI